MQLVDLAVSVFKLRGQLRDLCFVVSDHAMEVVEFCFYGEACVVFWIVGELLDEAVDLCEFLLVVLPLEEEGVLLEEEEVDPVEPLEVLVGGVDELVIIALHQSKLYKSSQFIKL